MNSIIRRNVGVGVGIPLVFLFTGTPVFAQAKPLTYVKDTTVKVCQLTGDWDFGWKMRTRTLTGEKHGVFFADLGSSFEHEGKVGFLFGDTLWAGAGRDRDFIAFSKGLNPYAMELEFHGVPAIPIEVPGIRHGQLEVPSGGISINGDIYIVFTTQSDGLHAPRERQMRKSVVALSDDDGKTWENLYTLAEADGDDFSGVHFINVSISTLHGSTRIHLGNLCFCIIYKHCRSETHLGFTCSHHRTGID